MMPGDPPEKEKIIDAWCSFKGKKKLIHAWCSIRKKRSSLIHGAPSEKKKMFTDAMVIH